MRARLVALAASVLFLPACAENTARPGLPASPVNPTAMTDAGSSPSLSPSAAAVEVPFHSELTWEKIPGSDISLCKREPPAGKVYLQRNTNRGSAVSTHLGAGAYENHTCVYGVPGRPEGWFADIRWTAANGDVLIATSDFLYWTGAPGKSVAVDRVTFQDGGTGRFAFTTGKGMAYVDAPARTALYDGTLIYGRTHR